MLPSLAVLPLAFGLSVSTAKAAPIDSIEDGPFLLMSPLLQTTVTGDPQNILNGSRFVRISSFSGADPGQARTIPSTSNATQVEAIVVDAGNEPMSFEIQYRSLSGIDVQGASGTGVAVEISDITSSWTILLETETATCDAESTMTIDTPGTYFFPFNSPDLEFCDFRSVDFFGLFISSQGSSQALTIEEITVVPEPTGGLLIGVLALVTLASPGRRIGI